MAVVEQTVSSSAFEVQIDLIRQLIVDLSIDIKGGDIFVPLRGNASADTQLAVILNTLNDWHSTLQQGHTLQLVAA